MADDTVTLVLTGEVTLGAFAEAIQSFHALVTALSAEAASGHIDWIIADLERGSALATARGIGALDQVQRVVRAYDVVGRALSANEPIRYSAKVRAAAERLRRLPGGKVESVRFETAESESIIRPRVPTTVAEHVTPTQGTQLRGATAPGAYGAVEGRIQTLTNRGSLRFTLYDLLEDRAVSCYLVQGHENMMRDLWGRLAVVEGWISRDPETGRALTVRRITAITPLPEPPPLRESAPYRAARAVAPSLSGVLPEHAIRRLRDDP